MKYPILAYKGNESIGLYGFSNKREIIRSSVELLKSGVFNNIILIDSSGNKFKMNNVRNVGWATVMWGLSLTRKGRQIFIDFDVTPIGCLSLNEMKEFIIQILERGSKEEFVKELRENVKKSESFIQIIELFY